MFFIDFLRKMRLRKVLRTYKENIKIHKSTILKNAFSIDHFVKPSNRIYIVIGKECIINCKILFESTNGRVTIGNNVYIGGAQIISRASVEIGNDVIMAWGITIYDHNSHSINWEHRKKDMDLMYKAAINNKNPFPDVDWTKIESKPVVIKDKVWIGFDAVILKGVTIGEGAVIAARSVVTRDVPPYTVVAGNPARVVKTI